MFPFGDGPHPHLEQNAIFGNSTKNGPTSRPHNFFKNGRTRLVYASFWSQGPPKLQKTGLGWFPRLARPLRPDLRNSRFFWKSGPSGDFVCFFENFEKINSQISKCCKNFKNHFYDPIIWIPQARNIKNISQNIISRKIISLKMLIFLRWWSILLNRPKYHFRKINQKCPNFTDT